MIDHQGGQVGNEPHSHTSSHVQIKLIYNGNRKGTWRYLYVY